MSKEETTTAVNDYSVKTKFVDGDVYSVILKKDKEVASVPKSLVKQLGEIHMVDPYKEVATMLAAELNNDVSPYVLRQLLLSNK